MRRMTDSAQLAADLLKSSRTYTEFKMKLDVGGVDMYNIDVLRSLRYRVPRQMRAEFESDVSEHIDAPQLEDAALNAISRELGRTSRQPSPFEVYLAGKWIARHEREYRH